MSTRPVVTGEIGAGSIPWYISYEPELVSAMNDPAPKKRRSLKERVNRHFNPGDALSPSQKAFAEQQLALFKTWYANWPGAATVDDHAHYRLAHRR